MVWPELFFMSRWSPSFPAAIDAMAGISGERRLELRIDRDRPALATVKIRDNGCGIAPEQLGKIFNPFYTSKENGTGLGLGVARKVVDAHRGMIEVVSEPGAGAEFVISIPLARGAYADEQSRPEEQAQSAPGPEAGNGQWRGQA